MKEFGNINSYDDFYIFELLIHNECNLKCSYCYMRNEDNTWGKSSSLKNIKIIKKILDKIKKETDLKICLSGGEPSIHPEIKNIVEIFANDYNEIHINTNLLSIDVLDDIMKHHSKNKFILHTSIHPDQYKINTFISKIKKINTNKNCIIEINYMVSPNISGEKHLDNLMTIHNEINLLQNIKFFVKFIYINNKFKIYKTAKDFIDLISDAKYSELTIDKEYYYIDDNNLTKYNDIDLIKNGFNYSFKGWNCSYTFFTINCSNFSIKQMCNNFNIKDIRFDYNFFIKYFDKRHKFKCPHQHCLWPSALDMKKIKEN